MLEPAVRVKIPYTPRKAFLPYHGSKKRFGVSVAHRRAGKTVARINKLIRKAYECELENPRFGYLAPTFVQAKDIAWLYMKKYAAPLLQLGKKPNESELSITLPHNGAVIRLYGSENYDRMRGLYFDGVCIDEGQDIPMVVLTEVILPALTDRKGWLDVSGTPKGWGNLLGRCYKMAIADPDWFVQMLKASETGIIDPKELVMLRASMSENEYDQEMECSFEAAITGAYYAKELQTAQNEGRITSVPYDPSVRVNTAWDLGMHDSMTIWFYQVVGKEIRVIDCYEASGYGFDHYAGVLDKRGYLYGKHYGPHDLAVRELGTGRSRLETAASLGIKFEICPNITINDGINAVRVTIPRMWFDAKKCETGLDAIKQYREKIDKKTGVAMGPLHDWSSHYADAFRYLCVSYQDSKAVKTSENTPRYETLSSLGWMGT